MASVTGFRPGGDVGAGDVSPEDAVVGSDIGFTHSLFVQCFLPMRGLPKKQDFYQVSHGNVSLAVRAGRLVDPQNVHKWEQCEVPAGPKARLVLAYINSQAIKTGNPEIDMGKSMREFMGRNAIPVAGSNFKELRRQVKNVAAADMYMGLWEDACVKQGRATVANEFSFWLEREAGQGVFWQPKMRLSDEYMKTLAAHRVPVDFGALAALQASPRAMDVYCWLAYRMYNMRRVAKIPYRSLHPIFGGGIGRLRDFRLHFRRAVMEAHKYYPEARLVMDPTRDYIELHPSPPAVDISAPKVVPISSRR